MPYVLLCVTVALLLVSYSRAVAGCVNGAVVCLDETTSDSSRVRQPAAAVATAEDAPGAAQEGLIEGITADLNARRLTRPPGNNALEKINRLKATMPDHDYSINGERYIARIYMVLGRSAVKKGDIELAEQRLKSAIRFDKQVPGKQALLEKILAVPDPAAAASSRQEAKRHDLSVPANSSGLTQRLIAPVMVAIPAGKFVMGSESGAEDEKPMHEVSIEAFSMSRYEITLEQYRMYAMENHLPAPQYDADDASHPVANVSWEDASDYARWLSARTGKSYRLATEAEWEYAARAGSTTPYHSGEDLLQAANCANCGQSRVNRQAMPVGSYPANDFGLYDMHGNVWEWVQDCWTDNYFGRGDNSAAIVKNNCGRHVLRGGSWANTADYARSSYRGNEKPSYRHKAVGFRVVHDGL